jgi:transposase
LILPEANAEAMSIFLEEVSNRHPKDCIMMVLDGAGWHRAKPLKVPSNMRLISLPPYNPQLNPIENIWEEIPEKWFSNKVFRHLDSVIDTLTEALLSLENDTKRVHKIAGFK